MFTSLRSRLWLSYALVITVALGVVAVILLVFLIRNPVVSRQVQFRLNTVRDLILENPQRFLNDPSLLEDLSGSNNVRVILFNQSREAVFDTNTEAPQIPFPRRNMLNQASPVALDAEGSAWIYTFSRMPNGRVLLVAAPRPRAAILNVFADEFFGPILQAGVIALFLSLILALALSRWVADPLQKVVSAARNYPADEIQPVEPRGPREVQDLTGAFNSMVARVHASQRSQRDFVANVSHELKTPLTSIQGFAQAILDETANTPEARRQAAQVIYDESARMHRMALDLLDLARLEAGTADLQMSEVDMNLLLQGVVHKFTPQAQKTNVALRLDVSDGLPPVTGDGDRLAQVFTNLIDNALKFTPADGGIVLSARKVEGWMEVSVTDSGIGVESEALPRLFDRFYQADPSRADAETASGRRGVGLGLAIAKEIVEAHGGKIGVRSQAGQGTTFVVHLPLDE